MKKYHICLCKILPLAFENFSEKNEQYGLKSVI